MPSVPLLPAPASPALASLTGTHMTLSLKGDGTHRGGFSFRARSSCPYGRPYPYDSYTSRPGATCDLSLPVTPCVRAQHLVAEFTPKTSLACPIADTRVLGCTAQYKAAVCLGPLSRAVRPSRPWSGMVICGDVSRPLPAARPRLATAAPAGPDSVWPRTGQIRVVCPPGIGPDAALARLVLVKRPSRAWPLVTRIGSRRLPRSLALGLDTSTQNVLRPQGPFLLGDSAAGGPGIVTRQQVGRATNWE